MGVWGRFIKSVEAREPLEIVVYSRQGCGCCERALSALESFRDRYAFRVDVIDVDNSLELKELYGLEVPVVAVDGRVRFRGLVNPAMLERLLRSQAPRLPQD